MHRQRRALVAKFATEDKQIFPLYRRSNGFWNGITVPRLHWKSLRLQPFLKHATATVDSVQQKWHSSTPLCQNWSALTNTRRLASLMSLPYSSPMSTTLTILSDNQAGNELQSEHRFAVHVQTASASLLFDTGHGAALFANAEQLGIDLNSPDVLSSILALQQGRSSCPRHTILSSSSASLVY